MENLEIEYKVMIDEIAYQKMKEWYSLRSFVMHDQINEYYDTQNEDLRKNHLSLRIRSLLLENRWLMTLKVPEKEGKREYEFFISHNDLNLMPVQIESILNAYQIQKNELFSFSSLRTFRYETQYENTTLCLDCSEYNGWIDYEMECEAESMEKARQTLIDLLQKQEICFMESSFSKVARARKTCPYFVKKNR